MNWTTTDGNSWKIRVGEDAALVWLHRDEKTYLTNVFLGNGKLVFPGQFLCLKQAKAACLEAMPPGLDIELNKPVILRGEMYKTEHITYHETVAQAAIAAYWAIERNDFMPCKIECEGKIVWENHWLAVEEYPSLASLAGLEEGDDFAWSTPGPEIKEAN